MKLSINTKVKANLPQVKAGFNEELFLKLNPPFPPVRLNEFGGCKKGDCVSLTLNFLLFKQDWVSDITEDHESAQEWLFVDEGVRLPFFLKTWKHRHSVRQANQGSIIGDHITYTTGTILTDLIMYPVLFFQFLYRKPIYKKFFKA